MTRDETMARVESELATAEEARKIGNDGMVRVCARRAAGIALSFWAERRGLTGWPADAMGQLRRFQKESVSEEARSAAERLTARITQEFTSAFPTDPLEDCGVIIRFCLT